ncbi:endonuclease/exonuclease/phosphatase family protein [Puniceibacterium sp. IMCC21224]|uniref:endonuclease/exonuclease/phosphatase family protein n=1 Tax=Puniceibacterium sp. IMCC21224 TaxID=1618204 RepID=UPI00064DE736|nr:endonuclease/exonuclease/phosphatase family protein [Puniceibacterium sp. IMCC21224]
MSGPLYAETIRVATWHAPLSRKGPGLLLRDILRGEDTEIAAVTEGIDTLDPDILLLTNIDYDFDLIALNALRNAMPDGANRYPYLWARKPNTGMPTGLDLDGDGRLGGPRDAQGFGYFAGQGGMALMSRFPVGMDQVIDFSDLLWRDLPGNLMSPDDTGYDVQRLSSSAHWDVPLHLPGDRMLHLLAFYATPPVFDGPEDRNGRRNHDEVAFWRRYLDGAIGGAPPTSEFVVIGDANLDSQRGDGLHAAMIALLADSRLTDPVPGSDSVHWPPPGPGTMRVSYVLPSADLGVAGAGHGPAVGPHRPVWVDLTIAP